MNKRLALIRPLIYLTRSSTISDLATLFALVKLNHARNILSTIILCMRLLVFSLCKLITYKVIRNDVLKPILRQRFGLMLFKGGREVTLRLPNGCEVDCLVSHTSMDLLIIREIHLLNVYLFEGKPSWVVLDVGAHKGFFTVKASKEVDNGIVIAIEPHPLNFMKLIKHVKKNELRNVKALNIAAGNECGEVKLYLSYQDACHSTKIRRSNSYIIVREKTIDNIVAELGLERVNFTKIDVEGAELEVLKGMQRTLEKCDMLSIAAHHYPYETEEVEAWLQKRGFLVYKYKIWQTDSEYLFAKRPAKQIVCDEKS